MSIQTPLPQGGINEIIDTTFFLLLAILAVIARSYARYLRRKAIAIDDYLIVAGLVFTAGTVGVGYALVLNAGVGLHMVDATPEQIAMALKLFVPAPLLWAIATFLIKLSVLFFCISIFTLPRVRTAVFIVITLSIALIVAVIFESFLLFRPFPYTWDKTITGGICGSSTEAYLAIAITNLVIDLSIVILPMPVLWGLQMPLHKKISISAVRINSVLALDPLDFTYTVVPDLIFGALEIELGIVNACLPILRPVFRKVFEHNFSFLGDWSLKPQRIDGRASRRKGSALIDKRNPGRMSHNHYPIYEAVQGTLSSKTVNRAHIKNFHDLESGEWQLSGNIMVREDLFIKRNLMYPAPTT